MASQQLRCACGNLFVADAAQLARTRSAPCPRCLRPVMLDGPSPVAAPPPKTERVLVAAPDASRMRLWTLVLGGGVAAVVAVVVLLLAVSGNDSPGPRSDFAPVDESLPKGRLRARLPDPPPPPPPPPPEPVPAQPVRGTSAPVQPSATPAPGGTPSTTPATGLQAPPSASAPLLPADVLQEARNGLVGLHPFYRDLVLTREELTRVEGLLKSGTGISDDVSFLQALLLKAKSVRDERAFLLESLERLLKESFDGLPIDRLVLADGRVMVGRILEETPEGVKLERKTSAGVGGVMSFKREALRAVEKGKGPGGEFKSQWDAAQKASMAELVALATWCRERGLTLQLQLVATKILTTDPGHAVSRGDLGLPPNPVARAAEAEKQGGFITHLGRLWTPRELKEKLIRDGYFLHEGQWYQRKERMFSVPGLFKYERQSDKRVLISGSVPLSHEKVTAYTMAQDIETNSFVEKEEVKLIRRFYAPTLDVKTTPGQVPQGTVAGAGVDVQGKTDAPLPEIGTPMTGEVFITVPVEEPIIEASVTTHAEVKSGGSITVYLIHNAERVRLYHCDAKEDDAHKLPDQIRGKTQVDLVAVISMKSAFTPKVERRRVRGLKRDPKGLLIHNALDVVHSRLIPDYSAMLFPSNSNTIEVFRLKATTGEPVPAITRLFQNAPPDLLKSP